MSNSVSNALKYSLAVHGAVDLSQAIILLQDILVTQHHRHHDQRLGNSRKHDF